MGLRASSLNQKPVKEPPAEAALFETKEGTFHHGKGEYYFQPSLESCDVQSFTPDALKNSSRETQSVTLLHCIRPGPENQTKQTKVYFIKKP